jgi:uncharacterized protein
MEKNMRREFLKKSIMGISGAALIPGTYKSNLNREKQEKDIPVLPTRILGKTGIKTPLISMGAGNANDPNFIKASYYNGIRLFFSATYYGEGKNEKLVGEGLKGLPRDSFVVGTAVTPDGFDTNSGKFTIPLNVDGYMKKAEASLKRFGLDYLDFLLFPYAGKRDVALNESLLKAFRDLKKQGKTRFVGLATHSECPEALRAAADSKFYDVVMTAYNFKIDKKKELDDAITYAVRNGVGVVAMKTLAGVYEDKSRTTPLNTNAALKWVLQNENISSVVSGMSSLEELKKNMAMISNLKISDQELKDLNLTGLNQQPGLYCHQCRTCMSQCPHNLEIPTIMRSYMYAYGYANMLQAKHTLAEAKISDYPCQNCEVCSVKCIAGFDVRDRISDILRLKDVPLEFLKG